MRLHTVCGYGVQQMSYHLMGKVHLTIQAVCSWGCDVLPKYKTTLYDMQHQE